MIIGSGLPEKVLVVVLAGGEGSRLMPLTNARTKPAVPIGAKFRLIDIPLSNAANSGLHKCLILTQGKDKSLNRHIKNTWYSDRHYNAFIEVISPQGVGKAYMGDADAVRQVINDIKEVKPTVVLIVPGDHLLKMNYFKFVKFLMDKNADAAIAVIKKNMDQAMHLGSLQMGHDEVISDFKEKDPETPFKFTEEDGVSYFQASMGIYAFKTKSLFKALKEPGELFGKNIIPQILKTMKVVGYSYNKYNIIKDRRWVSINDMLIEEYEKTSDSDYWRDVGTIDEYFKANMDLTGITPTFNIYGEKWPFFTCHLDLGPSKIIRSQPGNNLESAILGEGSILSNVSGRSLVISPKVFIEKSHMEDVIVFEGSTIQQCNIRRSIIDKNVVLVNMWIGFDEEEDQKRGIYIDPVSKIRVIPKGYDYTCQWFSEQLPKYNGKTEWAE